MNSSSSVEATPVEVAAAAATFAALGDPVRLGILAVLADGTHCVCDIQERVPLAANLLSYHLRVLREAGLIASARRGRWIDYRWDERAAQVLTGALSVTGIRAAVEVPLVAQLPIVDECPR